MRSELLDICDYLSGYGDKIKFEVVEAKKTGDGVWQLVIKRVKEEDKQGVANDNQ